MSCIFWAIISVLSPDHFVRRQFTRPDSITTPSTSDYNHNHYHHHHQTTTMPCTAYYIIFSPCCQHSAWPVRVQRCTTRCTLTRCIFGKRQMDFEPRYRESICDNPKKCDMCKHRVPKSWEYSHAPITHTLKAFRASTIKTPCHCYGFSEYLHYYPPYPVPVLSHTMHPQPSRLVHEHATTKVRF